MLGLTMQRLPDDDLYYDVSWMEHKYYVILFHEISLSFEQVYTNIKDDRPHLVNTAWAMLSLIDAGQVLNIVL